MRAVFDAVAAYPTSSRRIACLLETTNLAPGKFSVGFVSVAMQPTVVIILEGRALERSHAMPLFAVHLLFSLEVQAAEAPDPVRELAIHVLSAADEAAASCRGETIGRERQHAWRNHAG